MIPEILLIFLKKTKNKTKNLNGIRSAITKSYGETDGLKYYSLFKPYFKNYICTEITPFILQQKGNPDKTIEARN